MAEQVVAPNAPVIDGTPSGTPPAQPAIVSSETKAEPAQPTNGAAKPAPTLVEQTGDDTPPVPSPTTFPERWREIAADGDEKALKRLQRFTSPVTFFKSWKSAQDKISSGEHVRSRPQGDAADPAIQQALAEWRAEAGVPDKPEGYLENLPKGLVIGEQDKAIAESFIKDMHGQDAPPALVHKALEWFYGQQERMLTERAEADKQRRAVNEDALRGEWGNEYRANLNTIHGLLDTHGTAELKSKLFAARTSDGSAFGDDPEVLRFLANIAREINPAGTIIPTGGKPLPQAINDEIAGLEKRMATPRTSGWYQDEPAQQRYRELVEMRERLKARG